jgi:Rod binding domain-containing protein
MQPLGAMAGIAQSAANPGTGIDPRLKPAAHEFEACMMKEFLEPLQHDALFDDGKDGAGSDGSDNALMSFGSEALARAISDRGGFGIATKIIGQLEGTKTQAGGPAVNSDHSHKINGKSDSSALLLRR